MILDYIFKIKDNRFAFLVETLEKKDMEIKILRSRNLSLYRNLLDDEDEINKLRKLLKERDCL